MLMTVFINVNELNNLMLNIRETIYKENVTGKNAQDICQVINKSISRRLPFLLVKYECLLHCTLNTFYSRLY